MKITIENTDGVKILVIESDGEGHYKIVADRDLARRGGETEYETDDGFHVFGLLAAYFGQRDSMEFLTRKLKEQRQRRHPEPYERSGEFGA